MDPRWVLIAIPVAMVAFLVGYFTGRNNGYWDGYGVATNRAVENNKALKSFYQNEIERLKCVIKAMSQDIKLLYLKGEPK